MANSPRLGPGAGCSAWRCGEHAAEGVGATAAGVAGLAGDKPRSYRLASAPGPEAAGTLPPGDQAASP
jgi:hypothetical protein